MSELENIAEYSVHDDRFDIEKLGTYTLVMEIYEDNFRFTIFDHDKSIIIWLEDYHISGIGDLQHLFSTHAFLGANYWLKIRVLVNTGIKTMIPESVASKDNQKLLQYLFQDEDFVTMQFQAYKPQILLFGIASSLLKLIRATYVSAQDLEILPTEASCTPIDGLHLNFSNKSVDLTFVKNTVLVYTYSIALNTTQSLCRAIKQYSKLELETESEVWIQGKISSYSPYYKEIINIMQEVKFAKLPAGLRFTQYFQDMSESKYFTLFSILKTYS